MRWIDISATLLGGVLVILLSACASPAMPAPATPVPVTPEPGGPDVVVPPAAATPATPTPATPAAATPTPATPATPAPARPAPAGPDLGVPPAAAAGGPLIKIIYRATQIGMAVENYGGEFEPRILTVPPGTMVTWTNEDNKDHTVTSRGGLFDKRLLAGESFSYTFSQAGSFNYYDRLYDNMDGTVYVVDNP